MTDISLHTYIIYDNEKQNKNMFNKPSKKCVNICILARFSKLMNKYPEMVVIREKYYSVISSVVNNRHKKRQ